MPSTMASAHLAAGLAIGWWLARADARRRDVKEQEQEQEPCPPPAAAADAADADAADATSSAASSSAATTTTPSRQTHPSLEHAIAAANIKKTSSSRNAEAEDASASAPPALDLSSPGALAALFGGNTLSPLRVARDGRPIVAFDLEGTGLSVARDRIVEIAAVKVHADGRVEVKGPQRINPGPEAAARMPLAVVDLHGLSAEALSTEPRFEQVAEEWREYMRGCDLVGYNALRYDVPLLRAEFKRAGDPNFPPHGVRVLDGFRVFSRMAPRSLPAAVRVFCGGATMQGHHSALADAAAALAVIRGQLAAYPGLPRDAGELAQWCASPDDPGRQLTWCGRFVWDDGASARELEAFERHHAAAAAMAAAAAAGGAAGTATAATASQQQQHDYDLEPPPPPPPAAEAVFAFGKYRYSSLRAVAEGDREYLLWLIARREALSEEAAAIVAAALLGDFPSKGPGFAGWMARALERLGPAAGVPGGGFEEPVTGPGGTEAAERARWTGEALTGGAVAAAVAAAEGGVSSSLAPAAAAAATTEAEVGEAPAPPPPPFPLPAVPGLPGLGLGMPATVCHLPGDFEREAPSAEDGGGDGGGGLVGGPSSSRNRRRPQHNRGGRRGRGGGGGGGERAGGEGGAGAAAGGGDDHDDDDTYVRVRNVGVQVPETVVRGWDEALKAYLLGGEIEQAVGGKKNKNEGQEQEEQALPPAAGDIAAAAEPAALAAPGAVVVAPASPASAAPPASLPAFPAGDSWASSSGTPSPRATAAPPPPVANAPPPPPPLPAPVPPEAADPNGPHPGPIEHASLDWGRYKGKPLDEVAREDPAFLRWVVECLGASPWDRAAAAAALRAAGELDEVEEGSCGRSDEGSGDEDSGSGEGAREEEEEEEEEEREEEARAEDEEQAQEEEEAEAAAD